MKTFFLILFVPIFLFAAGPVTHLYLAERYCSIYDIQEGEWKEEFILGNLFPDIRYISHLSREETHLPINHLNEIYNTPCGFEAGMKFHHWVDLTREAFVVDTGIYSAILAFTVQSQATLLKFIEEEILADLYDGRVWSYLFDETQLKEIERGATPDQIIRWHTIVQYSLSYRPSWLLWGCSYYKNEAFGIPNTTLYNWSYLLPTLAQKPLFQNHMHLLLEHIENLLKSSTP